MQSNLYTEREHLLRLNRENDLLEVERLEDKKKIAYLLQIAGIKESELSLENRGRKILGMSPRKRVKFKEVKNFNKSVEEFREETLTEILQLKVNTLETELKQQTALLKEKLVVQSAEFDLRKKEWEVQKKRLIQQVKSLNSRLRNTQQFKFSEMTTYLEELDRVRERDVKLIEENDRLKRSVAMCKELLGEDYPDGKEEKRKRREESFRQLREKLEETERLLRNYTDRNQELTDEIGDIRHELEIERDARQREKEKLTEREDFFKRKLEEERKRRLMDAQGFAADVKLLRSKLQSVQRQIRQEQLRSRRHKDS